MTIALIAPSKNNMLRLDVNISTELGIDAQQAKRRVTRYFMDHVNMFIHPDPPLLVIQDDDNIFWRFPMTYSLGKLGKLGQVGTVDVDARSGKLLIDTQQAKDMLTNAERLAQGATHSAAA